MNDDIDDLEELQALKESSCDSCTGLKKDVKACEVERDALRAALQNLADALEREDRWPEELEAARALLGDGP